eukprot:7655-Heterococcus_DN1.PRE.3
MTCTKLGQSIYKRSDTQPSLLRYAIIRSTAAVCCLLIDTESVTSILPNNCTWNSVLAHHCIEIKNRIP